MYINTQYTDIKDVYLRLDYSYISEQIRLLVSQHQIK